MASSTGWSRTSSSPAQMVGTTNVPAAASRAEHGVVGERAVLDAVHPGLDRVLDPTQRMGVRGDGREVVVRDLDRGPQLVERVLDGPRVLPLRRQHRPGGHDLDHVGAPGELPADGFPHGIGAVRHLVHPRVVRHGGRGDREQPAGQEQAGAGHQTALDGLPHRHLHVVPTADVPHGRDARIERPLGRGSGEQRDRGVRAARGGGRVAGVGGLREVDMAVDEARQEPPAVELDDLVVRGAARPTARCGRSDRPPRRCRPARTPSPRARARGRP